MNHLAVFLFFEVALAAKITAAQLKELHGPCCGQNSSSCLINVECPAHVHSGSSELICNDGYSADPYKHEDKWSMCTKHGGRYRCPDFMPYLCARDNQCGGGTEPCCSTTCLMSDGIRECEGFETPVVPPHKPATLINLTNLTNTPWLEVHQDKYWIQCMDGELINIIDLYTNDRIVCTDNKIALCPYNFPFLVEGADYQTSLPIYRSGRHCSTFNSHAKRIISSTSYE